MPLLAQLHARRSSSICFGVLHYSAVCLPPLPNNNLFPTALPWDVADMAIFLLSLRGSQAPSPLGTARSTRLKSVLGANGHSCYDNVRAICKNTQPVLCRSNSKYVTVAEATGGSLGGREAGRAPEPRSLDCAYI